MAVPSTTAEVVLRCSRTESKGWERKWNLEEE